MPQPLHPVNVYAGQQLRALRKIKNMSQRDLGNQLSKPITFQQVQKYEKGVNRVSITHAYEFSLIFGVSVITFFPDEACNGVPVITRQEGKVLHYIRSLPENQQTTLIELIKVMKSNYGRKIPE